jgi:hypothetical protein
MSLVDQFQRSWREYFFPLIVRKAQLSSAHYNRFPSFDFQDEPVAAVAARRGFGMLALFPCRTHSATSV